MTTVETNTSESRKTDNVAITTAKIRSSASSFKRWGRKYPFIRYGIPMISLTVFGAVGLGHVLQGRLVQFSFANPMIKPFSNILVFYCIVILIDQTFGYFHLLFFFYSFWNETLLNLELNLTWFQCNTWFKSALGYLLYNWPI